MRRSLVTLLLAALALVGGSAKHHSAADGNAAPTLQWQALYEPGCGGWVTSVSVSPYDSSRVLVGGDMLGIGLSEDGGNTWQSTFGFKSWEIADFTWHPKDPRVVWVGTMSGPYVSSDAGRNWEPRRTGLPPVNWYYTAPIQKVLFDPNEATHLLAFGGSHRGWASPGAPLWGAVWDSRDNGNSWRQMGTVIEDRGRFAPDEFVKMAWGETTSSPVPIDLSGVTDPAPESVYRSMRWGQFAYTLPDLIPGAAYTVRLHFAEIAPRYADQAHNGRVFNVAINGKEVLSKFDIVAAAGAVYKAVVREFAAIANDQGQITVEFASVRDTALLSGLEVIPGAQGAGGNAAARSYAIDAGTGPAQGCNIVAVEFAAGSSSVVYAAVPAHGVFVSTDGGATWTAHNSGLPHLNTQDLATHPTQRDTLWVALDSLQPPGQFGNRDPEVQPGGVYKSTDGGLRWEPAQDGLRTKTGSDPNLTPRYQAIAVAPSAPDTLLTSDTAWDGGVVYGSRDGGASWQPWASRSRPDIVIGMPAGMGMTVVEFDPRDARAAFVAGSEYVLRTVDAGRTWTDVTAYHPDGSPNWRGRGYAGWVCTNFKFDPRDPKHSVWLAMDHGNFWQSRDGLQTWSWGGKGLPAWGGASDVAFAGSTMYVTLGQFGSFDGIARTTDGGESWTILAGAARGLPELNARAQAIGIYALPDEPNMVWAVIGGKLYHTADGGETWGIVHEGPELSWIEPRLDQPREFYVSGKDGIYHTTDGERFELIPGGPQSVGRFALDSQRRIYATSWRNSGLWRCADGQWQLVRDDKYISDVTVDPTDAKRLAVCTGDHPYHDECFATGVWISDDGGKTWTRQNAGLAVLRADTITCNPHDAEQLIVGTQGRGFFVTRWAKR